MESFSLTQNRQTNVIHTTHTYSLAVQPIDERYSNLKLAHTALFQKNNRGMRFHWQRPDMQSDNAHSSCSAFDTAQHTT